MSRQSLEERRLMAAEDLRKGKSQADVHRRYGVSRQSVSRWARAIRQGKSLQATPHTGRPQLVARKLIMDLCNEHPNAPGRELQGLIMQRFGVLYDIDHVLRLRKKLRQRATAAAVSQPSPARQPNLC